MPALKPLLSCVARMCLSLKSGGGRKMDQEISGFMITESASNQLQCHDPTNQHRIAKETVLAKTETLAIDG